jgi:NitT/TauT family transport system permease protein
MITATGVVIFVLLTLVGHLVLRRWHESAVKREG